MKRPGIPFIPYPPIARHGVIGDRRTGALVAADGTLDWFCVPEFDGEPVFGALLDAAEGGFCRWGPESAVLGRQRYLPGTAVLLTTWPETAKDENIELADVMAFPEEKRAEILCGQRIIIRRLRAKADATVSFALCPRRSFAAASGGACIGARAAPCFLSWMELSASGHRFPRAWNAMARSRHSPCGQAMSTGSCSAGACSRKDGRRQARAGFSPRRKNIGETGAPGWTSVRAGRAQGQCSVRP
jgi:hypothetical protein